ncbi:MAG: hypothetical protein ACRC46_01960 [Thermoguttaceae bacterium]
MPKAAITPISSSKPVSRQRSASPTRYGVQTSVATHPPLSVVLPETIESSTSIHEEDIHQSVNIIFRDGKTVKKRTEELVKDIREMYATREIADKQRDAFAKQFDKLLKILNNWCHENAENLSAACLAQRPTKPNTLCFLAIQKDNQYSVAFSDALTKLEMKVEDNADLYLVNLEVMEYPYLEDVVSLVNAYNYKH